MKIMMLAPGSWVHSRRQLKWLLDSGQEVVFIDHERPLNDESQQYKYITYPMETRLYKKLGTSITDLIDRWTVIEKLRWVRCWTKADLVHVLWVDNRAYQVVRANLHPLVLSVLGSDINTYFINNSTLKARQRVGYILRNADLILVDAEDMIEKCQELAGHHANVKLLSIGINTKKFNLDYKEEVAIWRRKLNLPADAIILLSIRALNHIYNHHLIIEAFSRAIQFFTQPTYLILKDYNTYIPYRDELKELIRTLGIESNVRWIRESVSDQELPVLYKLADLIINFPTYDAFPVTFSEAAASACPVISCYLPAYRNTFADKYFFMIETNNVDALCNGLIDFVNGNLRINHGDLAEAQKWIKENLDESVSARQLISYYQGLYERSD
jgi:glycosyltransferase involved in cell wall biosynthesis